MGARDVTKTTEPTSEQRKSDFARMTRSGRVTDQDFETYFLREKNWMSKDAFVKAVKLSESQIDKALMDPDPLFTKGIVALTQKLTARQVDVALRSGNPSLKTQALIWQDVSDEQLDAIIRNKYGGEYSNVVFAAELRRSGFPKGEKLDREVTSFSLP